MTERNGKAGDRRTGARNRAGERDRVRRGQAHAGAQCRFAHGDRRRKSSSASSPNATLFSAFSQAGSNPVTTALADVMTRNPKTIDPNSGFTVALQVMHDGRFRHLPVVEQGRVIGIVSVRDALGPELEAFVYEMLRQDQIQEVLA